MNMETITEYLVMQSHKGANGSYFDAWTLMQESDVVKACLLAEQMVYNGEKLGKVKKVKLETYEVWK